MRGERGMEDASKMSAENLENRERFLPRVKALWDILNQNPCSDKVFAYKRIYAIGDDQKDSPSFGDESAEEVGDFESSSRFDWNPSKADLEKLNFNSAEKICLDPLPPITNEPMVFEWTPEDIAKLTDLIRQWFEATEPRRKRLLDFFIKSKGVVEDETRESRQGGGIHDYVYHDRFIHLGDEEITSQEYDWLRMRYKKMLEKK
jgi:hypothetical protein